MPSRKSVKTVRRVLADGTVKTYRYRRDAQRDERGPTFAELLTAYRQSVEWRAHAPGTRRVYDSAFDKLTALRDVEIDRLTRGDVLTIRDHLADTPGACNTVLTALGSAYNWAIEREWIDRNPVSRVKRLPLGAHRRWSWEQIDYAVRVLPSRLTRAMWLALYTGQRQADVASMRWDDMDGSGIRVTQGKTGAKLWIPLHRDLVAMLPAWPREAVTILTDSEGKPWRVATLAHSFSKHCIGDPALRGLTFHGLRKTAAALLAEAGCSTHEIAAITGHKTLEMVAHYAAEADQRSRARAAVEKMENATAKILKFNDNP